MIVLAEVVQGIPFPRGTTCQAFDLVTESYRGARATLEDLGGNRCGCPEPTTSCKASSASLVPRQPTATTQ